MIPALAAISGPIPTAKDVFLLKEWLAADADPRQPADASLAEGVSCDEAGCVAQAPTAASSRWRCGLTHWLTIASARRW